MSAKSTGRTRGKTAKTAKASRRPAPSRRSSATPGRSARKGTGAASKRAVRAKRSTARPSVAKRPAARPSAAKASTAKPRRLGKRHLEEFRRFLESEHTRLSAELDVISQRLPQVEQLGVDVTGGYDEDIADVASDTFEREKVIAIEQSVQELRDQVKEALDSIKEGSYGTCDACGQSISLERLRALPYARLCISCKAREERENLANQR